MKDMVRKFHKQNSGSTLVIVLTVVAFLSILAVVVTSSAAANYRMKMVNKQAQKAFYTSEDAVNEIYAALGKVAMECFDNAYNEEMATVIKNTNIGGSNVEYTLSNLTTNSNLRKNFTYRLVSSEGLGLLSTDGDKYNENIFAKDYISDEEKDKFVNLLNSYLEDKEGSLQVESVGTIGVKKSDSEANSQLSVYTLTFQQCKVKYLTEEAYYSDIIFDGNIGMPDVYIDFATDVNNSLKTFTEYALIGNTGVRVEENYELNLNGNMYAGKAKGLVLNNLSTLTSGAVKIISGGDISVINANMNTSGAEIWCTSLLTQGTEGATVNILNGQTFVKDDLQVDGDNGKVIVGGSYFGYSYQGSNVSSGNHNNSSAIIVNGSNSVIDLSRINSLVIGGRAYIDYKNGDTSYATGESLSFIGSQEMYLVPSYLMNKSNPVVGTTENTVVNINGNTFFGYEFLDVVTPFTTRTVIDEGQQVTYYYLRFKGDSESAAFVKALFDQNAYNEIIDGKSKEIVSAYDKSRAYILSVVNANLSSLSSSVIQATGSAQVYTNGQMINAILSNGKVTGGLSDTTSDYTVSSAISTNGFVVDSYDLSNRYSLMTKILISPSFYNSNMDRNYISDANKIEIDGTTVDVSGYAENNIFANFISMEDFNELTSRGQNTGYFNEISSGVLLCAINNSRAIEISDSDSSRFKNYNSGIIVASGDVIVKKNFNGTIFAGGSIIIENDNVTITNNIVGTSILELIEQDEEYLKIFNAYRRKDIGSDQVDLGNLSYRDFVEFINWRKTL